MCEGSLAVVRTSSTSAALVADEVRRLVAEGMTPTEALGVATATVRRLLGLGRD